jgi:translation initiation factor 1 (eIF-1/SUI1)
MEWAELEVNEVQTYELSTNYDSRQSFYGKATVEVQGDVMRLISYTTIVATITKEVKATGDVLTAKVFGTYSATTLRHIKEFLKQNGFKAENSKQILKDYSN